jgi:hypothetical protein
MYLARAALASYEDADAFDHLCWRAGSFREEDVSRTSTIEGGDGAGDNHGRKRRLKMFGAAHELIAVHLRHEEIAEQEIERTGRGLFDDLERVTGGGGGNDAVAAGFEEEGSNREYLFVAVYAENRFLGPQ